MSDLLAQALAGEVKEAAPRCFTWIASAFLRDCARGPEVFYVAWLSLMSYARIVTHPKILRLPLTAAQAQRNIEALMTVDLAALTARRYEVFDGIRAFGTRDLEEHGRAVAAEARCRGFLSGPRG